MINIHKAGLIIDAPEANKLRCHDNGAIAISAKSGTILDVGSYTQIKKKYPKSKVTDHGKHSVITPGFVDCHVHAPQLEMTAAAGYSLLEWLDNHTFPTEMKYSNVKYAQKKWDQFCDALLSCGTTCASIYATSHTGATVALMKTLKKKGLRAHVGKILMDRNAPEKLLQPARDALKELEKIIQDWSKDKFVKPAITVRFAPTSTPDLLEGVADLRKRNPDLIVQTHLGETVEELEWVQQLFPKYNNYAEVYAEHNLIDSKSVLGHCIYLSDDEIDLIKNSKSHIAHCPSSNFFLGSGLFPYEKMKKHQVSIALATDVGAGSDLSMQNTARCCYQAQALQKYFMKPTEILYLMTRAGAKALSFGGEIGLLEKDFSADFIVHDLKSRNLLLERAERSESFEDILSALIFLGGESTIASTYISGKRVFKRH